MKDNMEGKLWFAGLAATLYLFFGAMQMAVGLGLAPGLEGFLLIPPDFMGGFVLFVVGSIFIFGVKELNSGIREGISYVYVGIVIALVLSGIYLLILGGDTFGEATKPLVEGEDAEEDVAAEPGGEEDEDTIDRLKPIIYLGLVPLSGFLFWRNKFTLTQFAE